MGGHSRVHTARDENSREAVVAAGVATVWVVAEEAVEAIQTLHHLDLRRWLPAQAQGVG